MPKLNSPSPWNTQPNQAETRLQHAYRLTVRLLLKLTGSQAYRLVPTFVFCPRLSTLKVQLPSKWTRFQLYDLSFPSCCLPLNANYFCPARNFIEAAVVFTFRLLRYTPYRTGWGVPSRQGRRPSMGWMLISPCQYVLLYFPVSVLTKTSRP